MNKVLQATLSMPEFGNKTYALLLSGRNKKGKKAVMCIPFPEESNKGFAGLVQMLDSDEEPETREELFKEGT